MSNISVKTKTPFRRVHLDFHTSEFIKDIGSEFSEDDFKNALLTGKIEEITLFAKCHHGWCYYPTKIGKMHPHLSFDLLGRQLEVCREIGVKANVYITGAWSAADADAHPEWQVIDWESHLPLDWEHGKTVVSKSYGDAKGKIARPFNSWKMLCLSGAYGELVKDFAREVCELYNPDGLFFDIVCLDIPCTCPDCLKGMSAKGFDPEIQSDVREYMVLKKQEFMRDCGEILHSGNEDATIFFNSGGAEIEYPQYHSYHTHFELEDLPTTGSGYDKAINRFLYFSRYGKFFVGQTGIFHTDWGEFGSIKLPDALKYECATMLAYGAGCCIGDQLAPSGKMNREKYDTIGYAYDYVEKLEPYCAEAQFSTRLGVVLSNDLDTNEGLGKILLESQFDYRVVRTEEDLVEEYDTIIIADGAKISVSLGQKLDAFIKAGRGLVLIGSGGVDPQKGYILNAGIEYLGKSKYDCDYILASECLKAQFGESPLLNYLSANRVEFSGAETLAYIKEPFFSRTYKKYFSHRNTPYKPMIAGYPAAAQKNNILYIANDLCKNYNLHGSPFHRNFLVSCLKRIYQNPVLETGGLLTAGRATLRHQPKESRYILHLFYASPVKRGDVFVLEDMPVIKDINVKLRVNEIPVKVTLVPQEIPVEFEIKEGKVVFTVDRLQCHQAVTIDY